MVAAVVGMDEASLTNMTSFSRAPIHNLLSLDIPLLCNVLLDFDVTDTSVIMI